MNKQRRKDIEEVVELLRDAVGKLRDAADAEQEYYDNMPENMQQSDKGSTAEEAAQSLSDACDEIENAISTAEEVVNN